MAVNMEAVLKIKMLAYFKEQLVKIFAPKDLASTTKEGLMSKADKAKLDGIDANANRYEHPASHSADMITETTNKKWLTPAQISSWDAAKATADDTKNKFDTHVASIVEVTDAEVKELLDAAGLTEITQQ